MGEECKRKKKYWGKKNIKLEQVKKSSKIGRCGDTFRVNYDRIPDDLKDQLTPDQLGRLTDAFYECYGEGKKDNRD